MNNDLLPEQSYSIAHHSASSADSKPSSQLETTETPQLLPPESIRPLKILFITPQGKKDEDSNQKALFAMGIGILVSITPKQHQIELVDELFGDKIHYQGDYDLVAITTRTLNATRAYEIADKFRQHGKKVVLGGVHASFNYEEAIAHCDAVVHGEAENLWTTVLQDVAQGTLKPHYDSRDFPPVEQTPGLDYERIFNASKRGKVDVRKSIPIYTTRGCPYSCSFCVTPNFTGKLYRIQEPEAIKNQIEQAKRVFFQKTRLGKKPWFMFTDENFGVNKKKMWEILEAIKECDINFSTFISINFLEDAKTVRLLVEAGCVMVLVGFESINEETLKAYGKTRQNSVEKFTKIIENCRKAGLCVQGNFLVNPAIDTYEDMDAVLAFVRDNHIVMPIYSLLTPYPGTALYLEYKEKGLIVDEDWDKYTAQNLIVRCDKYDPLEYQINFLQHYLAMYSRRTIVGRVWHNPIKLITLITSILFRKNLQDQLKSVKLGKRQPVAQPRPVPVSLQTSHKD